MNEKQQIFIHEYLKDFNGTRAYKEAYKCSDSVARRNASRLLLTNADIQKAIQEQANKRLDDIDVDVNYIVSNIKEVVERCMQKEPVEEGVWTFNSTGALKGLELLGKYKAIFTDKVEADINQDINITIE